MAATGILNVRLPEELMTHGLQVIEKSGTTTSEVIRELFRQLEKTQALPDFMNTDSNAVATEKEKPANLKRRELMASMVGILNEPIPNKDAITAERLERHLFIGVRE